MVIQVMRSMTQENKAGTSVVIIENFKVHTDKVNFLIGNPISHDQYIKKGKKNPNGDNHYSISKNKYSDLLDDEEEDTADLQVTKNSKKDNRPVKNQLNNLKPPGNGTKGQLRLSFEEETKSNPNSNTFKSNNLKSNQLSKPGPKIESPRNRVNSKT